MENIRFDLQIQKVISDSALNKKKATDLVQKVLELKDISFAKLRAINEAKEKNKKEKKRKGEKKIAESDKTIV